MTGLDFQSGVCPIANSARKVNATFVRCNINCPLDGDLLAAISLGMRFFLTSFGFLLVLFNSGNWSAGFAQDPTQVSLELVLAVDTSTSVDSAEFALQQQGLAAAFRHPSVRRAIENAGPQGIAVSLVQWSGPGKQRTSVSWRHLRDSRSIEKFAAEVGQAPRLLTGFTDIAGAIRFSHHSLNQNRFTGLRQVIDVSGDGSSNGPSAQRARDQAIEAGITVNGLVIHNEEYDLGELAKINLVDHYRTHVVGGVGSFLMIAKDFEDFREAIRKKLVREITGPLFSHLSIEFEDLSK